MHPVLVFTFAFVKTSVKRKSLCKLLYYHRDFLPVSLNLQYVQIFLIGGVTDPH